MRAVCEVSGCTVTVPRCQSLCRAHAARLARYGDPEGQQQTYPFEPLLRLSGVDIGVLAEQVGVTVRTAQRWQQEGLSAYVADRAACRLGLLPYRVWPDWLTDGLAPEDRYWPLEEWWRPAWLWNEAQWQRVEHFHEDCYVAAGEPYGEPDASNQRPVFTRPMA